MSATMIINADVLIVNGKFVNSFLNEWLMKLDTNTMLP